MTYRRVALLAALILVVVPLRSAPVVHAAERFTTRFTPAIPITLPIPQSADPNAITFANVLDHVSEIPTVAWTRVQKTIAANTPVTPKIKISIALIMQTTIQ